MSGWLYSDQKQKKSGKKQTRAEDILKSIEDSKKRGESMGNEFSVLSTSPDRPVVRMEPEFNHYVPDSAKEFTSDLIEKSKKARLDAQHNEFKIMIQKRASMGLRSWEFAADIHTWLRFQKFAELYLDPNYTTFKFDNSKIEVKW